MKKEIKVYVISCNSKFNFISANVAGNFESIINMSEKEGAVYSLQGFQNAVNIDELDLSNTYILIH